MASETWSDMDGHSPDNQDQLDRQMIRHLLGRYSRDELSRLLQEEGIDFSLQDASSFRSCSTFSTVKSEDASLMFDSASAPRGFSDASSAGESSLANRSPRTTKPRPGSNQMSPTSGASSLPVAGESPWEVDDGVSTQHAPKQKGNFICGFCLEEGIQKSCTRKNDLKRHIEDFHHTNAQWFCRHRGCHKVFDWQTAFKAHLKQAHGGSRMGLDEAKVILCPQTVFACGFENCLQVFESPSDAEAATTFKEYVSHVVKHIDEGASSGQWSYSARIRNLLRQSAILSAWGSAPWPEADHGRLRWNPQTSGALRKQLETRHLGEVQSLVQYAVALGSSANGVGLHAFPANLATPVRVECQMAIHGHKSNHGLSTPPRNDSEPIHYALSAGPGPGLGAYYGSQRSVYQHPSDNSAKTGLLSQPPMQGVPNGYEFDSASMFGPQHHHLSMMSQTNGVDNGTMADPHAEYMDMGDSPMEHANYGPPPRATNSFSPPYGPGDDGLLPSSGAAEGGGPGRAVPAGGRQQHRQQIVSYEPSFVYR